MNDPVPDAFTVGTPTADLGGDCSASSGNLVTCALPSTLAPGPIWTVTVPYSVEPSVSLQTVVNVATVTNDESFAGVTAADSTDVTESSDLGVTVTDGLVTVAAGGPSHSYLITVSNAGISDATGATLSVTWPADFVQGAISPSQGTCAVVGAGPDLQCDLGTLGVAASATVAMAFTVPAGATLGDHTIVVEVDSSADDPNPSNDTATDVTTVVAIDDAPDTATQLLWPRDARGGALPTILLLTIVGCLALFSARVRSRPSARSRHDAR